LGKTKTAIELIIDGTSIDMNVMKEYVKNLNEKTIFTLEGLAIVRAVKLLCSEIMKDLEVVSGYNAAKHNEAITDILIEIEQEEVGEDDSQYYT